nr:hypothetical protein [Mycoplasmopsis bovis]
MITNSEQTIITQMLSKRKGHLDILLVQQQYLMTNLSIYLAWFILSATVPNIGYLNLGYTQITYLAKHWL